MSSNITVRNEVQVKVISITEGYLHTYIHTYIHAYCEFSISSMRNGVVVGYLLMKEDGWMGCSSGMIIGLLPSQRTKLSSLAF